MNEDIKEEVFHRGIQRLCHFTPSRNLIHIASGEVGILATKHLQDGEREVFTPTDLQRLDGHTEYISCSIEYPNVWYFDKAKLKEVLFKDWVILFIKNQYLWANGTLFCPRNASAKHGSNVCEGYKGFKRLFVKKVEGAYGRTYGRADKHLVCSPTDDQAEVLVVDKIVSSDILAIAVLSESQAKNEITRFKYAGVQGNKFKFVIAPDLFKKDKLSNRIRNGIRPKETLWKP